MSEVYVLKCVCLLKVILYLEDEVLLSSRAQLELFSHGSLAVVLNINTAVITFTVLQ